MYLKASCRNFCMKFTMRSRKTFKRKRVFVTLVLCLVFWFLLQSGVIDLTGSDSMPDNTSDKNIRLDEIHPQWFGQTSFQGAAKMFQVASHTVRSKSALQFASPGELLAGRLQKKCSAFVKQTPKLPTVFPITINTNYNLMFCPMCKLASTYWTKFFKFLEMYNDSDTIQSNNIQSPFDIPLSIATPTKDRLKITRGVSGTKMNNFYKFMFVRDPYSRILSAYVDKLFAPNPTFWRGHCKGLIAIFRPGRETRSRCGSDLKFEEYIRGIITAHKRPYDLGFTDCHDASFMGSCHPCEVQYDFIGKMENFTTDSHFIYRKLNLSKTLTVLQTEGKQLADDDAIYDTVTSPFNWKSDITTCIPWMEALKRVWRKLQIRGIIGKENFPLTKEECDEISRDEFIALIKAKQKLTPYSERKKQRTDALIEIFSQVDMKYLQALKTSYKNDFHFFEYNDNPSEIFYVNRSNIKYYGYLDVS